MNKLIFLIGLHGTGKSTIGKLLSAKHEWQHFSVGDLGRASRRRQLVNGVSIRLQLALTKAVAGKPLSLEIGQMLVAEMQLARKKSSVVVDGFPSSIEHLQIIPTDAVVHLIDCSDTVRKARLERRAQNTDRGWQEGIESERDRLLPDVWRSARGRFPLGRVITNDEDLSATCALSQGMKDTFLV